MKIRVEVPLRMLDIVFNSPLLNDLQKEQISDWLYGFGDDWPAWKGNGTPQPHQHHFGFEYVFVGTDRACHTVVVIVDEANAPHSLRVPWVDIN